MLLPDTIHNKSKNKSLNQSIVSQKSPPSTTSGLKPYSSTKMPKFQNNLREISSEKKLNKNNVIDNFLVNKMTPPI